MRVRQTVLKAQNNEDRFGNASTAYAAFPHPDHRATRSHVPTDGTRAVVFLVLTRKRFMTGREEARFMGRHLVPVFVCAALGGLLGFIAAGNHDPTARCPVRVTVYGCGVHTNVTVPADEVVPLREIMSSFGPIPVRVTHAVVETDYGNFTAPVPQLLGSNGPASLPIFGGERVLLIHADK